MIVREIEHDGFGYVRYLRITDCTDSREAIERAQDWRLERLQGPDDVGESVTLEGYGLCLANAGADGPYWGYQDIHEIPTNESEEWFEEPILTYTYHVPATREKRNEYADEIRRERHLSRLARSPEQWRETVDTVR